MRICGMNFFVLMNFVLSFLIFTFGCWAYVRTKNKAPFYIGAAFGLFSLSHLMALVGISRDFRDTLVLIRAFSYFIVLTTLYHMGRKSV